MFLIRAMFWIGAIVIALPLVTGAGEGQPANYDPEPVQLAEVAIMVQTTAADLLGFCDRQPDACETGQRLLWTTREAATDLAGKAHVWLSEGPSDQEDGS